jgi:hypothetical protein
MMHQGLATLAPHEIEQRKELMKQAVELMTTEDQRQLVSHMADKTGMGESKDADDRGNTSGDTSSDTEEADETPRRSSRPIRKKPERIQWWNPQTKQYEGGGAKTDVVTAAKSKKEQQQQQALH